MSSIPPTKNWNRRTFLKTSAAGVASVFFNPFQGLLRAAVPPPTGNPVFWVDEIPDMPYTFAPFPNYHAGFETLLFLLAVNGLKFYKSNNKTPLSGPIGLIAADDVVLIKVNAQWKYRGCTNSDLVRGLIQRVLDHPDGYTGEVVIFENGQGRGSLACDTTYGKDDKEVHANANDERQSFLYLVNTIFKDKRVSARLLDDVRKIFLTASDHVTDGFRKFEDVSYPCFTTDGGRRVELKEGLWNGSGYSQNLKLINVPVLKHHDEGGSEITASLKHFYGVVSMADGSSPVRHYGELGRTTGTMVAKVRTPVLNIIDAIWVSYASIKGFPAETTFRANQVAASQDPVALDAFSAKNIIYPIDKDERHSPAFPGIDAWLTQARDTINTRGGLYNPSAGVYVNQVTKDESRMQVFSDSAARFVANGPILPVKPPAQEPVRTVSPGGRVPPRGNPSIIR
jgi:hypothetical protein